VPIVTGWSDWAPLYDAAGVLVGAVDPTRDTRDGRPRRAGGSVTLRGHGAGTDKFRLRAPRAAGGWLVLEDLSEDEVLYLMYMGDAEYAARGLTGIPERWREPMRDWDGARSPGRWVDLARVPRPTGPDDPEYDG